MDEGIFLKYLKNIIISLCYRLHGSLLIFLVRGAIDLVSTQHVSFLTLLAPFCSTRKGFFGHFEKTQAPKNSKLKENLEKTQAKFQKKTQKPATPVELSCC